nr:hypothetical protein [Tanacetum cinerariifolium]
MGYEHLSTIPEMESDEVIKSNVKNLVQIPSVYEGSFDNTCDVPVCEDSSTFDVLNYHSEILSDSNNDDTSSDDDAFEDIEYVEASLPDSELVSLEGENDVYQEEKEIDLEDIFQIHDVILHEKLLSINCLIADIEFLNDNHTLDRVLKSSSSFPIFEKSDNSLSYSDNSSPEFETFSDHTEETRSGSTTAHANNSPPEYDLFCFEIEPDQGSLTSVVMNDISDNSTNDPLLESIDLFLVSDNSIPTGIENIDYDSEGDIYFLEELFNNDSLPLPEIELSNFDHHEDPSFPHPLPKPPDVEIFFKPNSGVLTTNVVNGISEHYVLMPNILPTLPTFDPFYPVYDTLLPFSLENKDKVFKLDTPILSIKEPENSLSMGYEHLSITPETESDEVTKSNAKNLLPIPSECEFTSEDKRECDELERLINLVENDVPDNSSNDPLLEEVDLFLFDNSIPPGIENVADDPEGDNSFFGRITHQ